MADVSPAAAAALEQSIIDLGHDIWSMKLYWLAISTVYFYDYFLTLDDEIKYMWKGRKSLVFWLFFLNRYLTPIFIIISIVADFDSAWTTEICARFGFMETLETTILTTIAQILLTLRVYALTGKKRLVLFIAVFIMIWQWAIALYAMSQSYRDTAQIAVLLSKKSFIPGLPELPDTDAYRICIFIVTLTVTPWVEAFLCLSLAFDGLVFLTVTYITLRASGTYKFVPLMNIILRDGIMYFFVLFSSNLAWLLLIIHAPPGLKFIQNQPAMVLSAIMINRITLNLKSSAETIANASHASGNKYDGQMGGQSQNEPFVFSIGHGGGTGHAYSQSDYEMGTVRPAQTFKDVKRVPIPPVYLPHSELEAGRGYGHARQPSFPSTSDKVSAFW